ncbi:FAD-dependent oxidoreductase, partial [Acidovorax sp.]|uniref:FAD-dependent oxidoreductase n=1 Tax=Acidovorax sp. TaxID=1872122 RepID=UPI0025C2247C
MSSTTRIVKTDVAIVGGGIVGASAALALRRKGVDVVLLERDRCGSRSSGGNNGGVGPPGPPLNHQPRAPRPPHNLAA